MIQPLLKQSEIILESNSTPGQWFSKCDLRNFSAFLQGPLISNCIFVWFQMFFKYFNQNYKPNKLNEEQKCEFGCFALKETLNNFQKLKIMSLFSWTYFHFLEMVIFVKMLLAWTYNGGYSYFYLIIFNWSIIEIQHYISLRHIA